MSNIIDYANLCTGISFEKKSLNEVDFLILSVLSYINLDDIVDNDFSNPKTFKQIHDEMQYKSLPITSLAFAHNDYYEALLRGVALNKRFSDVKIMNFVNKIDVDKKLQFAALTYEINDHTIFVSFRGTDDTIVGWEEDLYLTIKEEIPAHVEALHYLLETSKIFPNHNIYLGGHSKGGNLAVYCALNAPDSLKERFKFTYSFDGPGFINPNVNSDSYQKMQHKIMTFVPQSSIVGMLFNHKEPISIIKSCAKGGFNQHSAFTWEINSTHFEYLDDMDKIGKLTYRTIRNTIISSPAPNKEKLVLALSQIIVRSENSHNTLSNFKKNFTKNIIIVLKSYRSLSNSKRKCITSTIRLLSIEGIKSLLLLHTKSSKQSFALMKTNNLTNNKHHKQFHSYVNIDINNQ